MKQVLKKTIEEAKAIVSKVSFSVGCASVLPVDALRRGSRQPSASISLPSCLLPTSLLLFCFWLCFPFPSSAFQ